MNAKNSFSMFALSMCLACFTCPLLAADKPGNDGVDQDRPGPECMADDRMDGPGPDGKKDEFEKAIGLTAEQKTKMDEQRKRMRESGKETFKAVKAKHDQIRAEMEKSEFNKKAVLKLAEELKALENKITDERINGLIELRSILSVDQFKKLNECIQKHPPFQKMDQKKHKKAPKHMQEPPMKEGPGPDQEEPPMP